MGIISIAMIASSVFFLMESMSVDIIGRRPCTLVLWSHWLQLFITCTCASSGCKSTPRPFYTATSTGQSLSPLQMIEFYLILSAVKPDLSQGMFWRLLLGTVAMLAFGYAGEAGFLPAIVGFVFGMAGWMYILMEIFKGEAGTVAADGISNKHVQASFNTMRFIVTVGWSIYPLGYFFGYLLGAVQDSPLNLVYNLADFVNKIAFCLAIWASAKNSTMESKLGLLP